MAGSVNKVILVGNVGRDPETRNMQSGDAVTTFSIATSESWKNRDGERQEKTQWHRIAIFNQKIGEIAQRYVKKGSKVYIEGSIESRKYTDKDGNERETTEIVLGKFRGELTLLGDPPGGERSSGYGDTERQRGGGGGAASRGTSGGGRQSGWEKPKSAPIDDDDIPF